MYNLSLLKGFAVGEASGTDSRNISTTFSEKQQKRRQESREAIMHLSRRHGNGLMTASSCGAVRSQRLIPGLCFIETLLERS